jgi:hypothetical protein
LEPEVAVWWIQKTAEAKSTPSRRLRQGGATKSVKDLKICGCMVAISLALLALLALLTHMRAGPEKQYVMLMIKL